MKKLFNGLSVAFELEGNGVEKTTKFLSEIKPSTTRRKILFVC